MAVRRVRRVIRKIDPWTVLKVSVIFNAIGGLVFVLGVWVMWSLAIQRGIPERISEFFANFALVFNAEGELYFRVVVLLTIIGVVVLTGLFTLGAVVYNLISDVVGGIEVIVLEETYALAPARQVPLRPAVHMPATTDVDTVQDASVVPIGAGDNEEEAEPEPDEAIEAAAVESGDDVSDDDDTVEQDVLAIDDDEAPMAAASDG